MAWRGSARDGAPSRPQAVGSWRNRGAARADKSKSAVSPKQAAHWALTIVLAIACICLWNDARAAQRALARTSPIGVPENGVTNEQGQPGAEQGEHDHAPLKIRLERKVAELETTRKLVQRLERKVSKSSSSNVGKAEGSANDNANLKLQNELEKLQKRDKALVAASERQTDAIASLSRELILRKFGHSKPYRAKITVRFPDSMGDPKEGEIILELAASEMPTAVLYFMSQVEAGLWNGCSFIRNAHHVLQASAQSPNRAGLHRRFSSLPWQGSSIPFQEYSNKVPHQKYTVGLAGRPGGPDFYISTVDNTHNHGPGGQSSYDLPEEADPCFGKVVEGFEVVERMHSAPRERNSFQGLVEFIGIKAIDLLV
mmetsp:Transcript_13419/g.42778  ORF Transcript_13419/g.42778 Transcript_13419/m.42778 type:complete len:371 (+) Transcript_13419:90-1202(+)